MTKRFNKFYKMLLETKFSELPDERPYGFWIFPSGYFQLVTSQNHHKVALQIINAIPRYKEEFDKIIEQHPNDNNLVGFSAYYFLAAKKYIPAVINGSKLFYRVDSTITPSQKQLEIIRDLAIFYNVIETQD